MTLTLEQMYEKQKELDGRIIKGKGLEGQDLLPNTVLALQVEIAELANEWRGFKHWSDRREPKHGYKALIDCAECHGKGFWFDGPRVTCDECDGNGKVTNPLLQEYVDCLHFFLSLARQLEIEEEDLELEPVNAEGETSEVLIELFVTTGYIFTDDQCEFFEAWNLFWALGQQRLGFNFEQIAAAYAEKNAVNHRRQSSGY